MADVIACPDPHDLRRLAQGELSEPDAERLGRHVLGCSACAELLNSCQAEDPLVAYLQAGVDWQQPDNPVVVNLVERLLRAPPGNAVSTTPFKSLSGTTAVNSVASLVQLLRDAQLFTEDQLSQLPELQEQFPGPRRLAKELLDRGWLTRYQLKRLLAGRGRELHLGPYVLLELLGEGGMGQVFKARHEMLGRLVALKLLRKELVADPEVARRFQREVQAAAHVAHPNIVLALDADQVAGVHFFAMEYVEGTDLAQLVKQSGPLPIAQACDYVRQAALGLQHAHERGLVHRDIKPANLMLAAKGSVIKVLDLGLARLTQPVPGDAGAHTGLTQTGMVMGTPDFIAPEQVVDARSADIRSDLYSLGCTLYFLLTGQVPFPVVSLIEKLDHHRWAEPRPIRELRPEVPPVVAAVVARMMAKKPEARFQTPAEVAGTLTLLAEGRGIPAMLYPPASYGQQPPSATPQSSATAPAEDWAGLAELPVVLTAVPGHQPRGGKKSGLLKAGVAALLGLTIAAVLLAAFVKFHGHPAPEGPKEDLKLAGSSSGKSQNTKREPIPAKDSAAAAPPLVDTAHPIQGQSAVPGFIRTQAQANVPWQDTLIDTTPGKPLTLQASGQWLKGGTGSPPDGNAAGTTDRVETLEAARMCLLGRIGSGEPFAIGSSVSLEPKQGGRLFVQANDLDLQDAQGNLDLKITGGTPQTSPAPRPGPTMSELAEIEIQNLTQAAREPNANAESLRAACLAFRLRFPGVPQTVRLTRLLQNLGSGPLFQLKTTDIPLTERFRWQEKLVAVFGKHRWWHGTPISSVAISSDGAWAASGDDNGVIRLWNAATGEERVLRGHTSTILAMAFAPSGQVLVASARDGKLIAWQLTQNRHRELEGGVGPFDFLVFSNDGALLAAGNGSQGKVFLWDMTTPTRSLRGSFQDAGKRVLCLAFAPDNKVLATGTHNNLVRLWSLGKERTVLRGTELVRDIPVKPEGRELDRHTGPIACLAFSADGTRLASGSADTTVKFWDVVTHQEIISLQGHKDQVRQVGFSGDGKKVLSIGQDGQVKFWEVATGEERSSIAAPINAGTMLSRDGKLFVTGLTNGSVVLIDSATGKDRRGLGDEIIPVTAVALAPDGLSLALAGAGPAGEVKLIDVATGNVRIACRGHTKAVTALAFAPSSKFLATAGADATVRLWDTATGAAMTVYREHKDSVSALAFAPDGLTLASASADKTVKLWDLASNKAAFTITALDKPVIALAFAPHGKSLLTGSENGVVRLWEGAGWSSKTPLHSKDNNRVWSVAFAPDGASVAACVGDLVHMWNTYSGRPINLPGGLRANGSIAFTPDNQRLVALEGSDLAYYSLDGLSEKIRKTVVCTLCDEVLGITIAADGRHVATANGGGTAYIFLLPTPD